MVVGLYSGIAGTVLFNIWSVTGDFIYLFIYFVLEEKTYWIFGRTCWEQKYIYRFFSPEKLLTILLVNTFCNKFINEENLFIIFGEDETSCSLWDDLLTVGHISTQYFVPNTFSHFVYSSYYEIVWRISSIIRVLRLLGIASKGLKMSQPHRPPSWTSEISTVNNTKFLI